MKDNIIIGSGTAGGAMVLEALQKYEAMIQECEQRLKNLSTDSHEYQNLKTQFAELKYALQFMAIDVDTTNRYTRNRASENSPDVWPIATFIPCTAPGPATIEEIGKGAYKPQYDLTNPNAIKALQGNADAAGGTRPNGALITELHIPKIVEEFSKRLTNITQRRMESASTRQSKVRVILIGTTFGGFASAAKESIRRALRNTAARFGVEIDLLYIVLIPGGTNQPDNFDHTAAVTHAVLKEQAALATNSAWQCRVPDGSNLFEMEPVRPDPVLYLTDTNNAPGTPHALSISDFNGLGAEIVLAIALTDIGEKLSAKFGDMASKSAIKNRFGENLSARSAGMSIIHLDRSRGKQFLTARIELEVLNRLLQDIDLKLVLQDVSNFLKTNHLLEGKGVTQLSDTLLESNGVNTFGVIEDFERVFGIHLSNSTESDPVVRAKRCYGLAVRQNGDVGTQLTTKANARYDTVVAQIQKYLTQLSLHPDFGVIGAQKWTEVMASSIANLVMAANTETAVFETEVSTIQKRIEELEKPVPVQPKPEAKGFGLKNLFPFKGKSKESGQTPVSTSSPGTDFAQYTSELVELYSAKARLQSHLEAIDLLGRLSSLLEQRLKGEATSSKIGLEIRRETLKNHIQHITEYRPNYECPVGLSLLNTKEDFESFFSRLLPTGKVQETLNAIFTKLTGDQVSLVSLGEADQLRTLQQSIHNLLAEQIQVEHIVDELYRRFPTDESLGAMLRRRDLESFEYLKLKDNADQEHTPYVIRYVAMDTKRQGEFLNILNRFATKNRKEYEIVHIDDPERIIFFQFRAGFPVSSWIHYESGYEIYRRTFSTLPFDRHHVVPGDRFLPAPGRPLPESESRLIALKAWILERLAFDGEEESWKLLSALHRDFGQEIGSSVDALLEHFGSSDGYAHSVDVVSHFNCFYRMNGPDPIRQKLTLLHQTREGQTNTVNATNQKVAQFTRPEDVEKIRQELKWWEKNTVPAAMVWHSASNLKKQPTSPVLSATQPQTVPNGTSQGIHNIPNSPPKEVIPVNGRQKSPDFYDFILNEAGA